MRLHFSLAQREASLKSIPNFQRTKQTCIQTAFSKRIPELVIEQSTICWLV